VGPRGDSRPGRLRRHHTQRPPLPPAGGQTARGDCHSHRSYNRRHNHCPHYRHRQPRTFSGGRCPHDDPCTSGAGKVACSAGAYPTHSSENLSRRPLPAYRGDVACSPAPTDTLHGGSHYSGNTTSRGVSDIARHGKQPSSDSGHACSRAPVTARPCHYHPGRAGRSQWRSYSGRLARHYPWQRRCGGPQALARQATLASSPDLPGCRRTCVTILLRSVAHCRFRQSAVCRSSANRIDTCSYRCRCRCRTLPGAACPVAAFRVAGVGEPQTGGWLRSGWTRGGGPFTSRVVVRCAWRTARTPQCSCWRGCVRWRERAGCGSSKCGYTPASYGARQGTFCHGPLPIGCIVCYFVGGSATALHLASLSTTTSFFTLPKPPTGGHTTYATVTRHHCNHRAATSASAAAAATASAVAAATAAAAAAVSATTAGVFPTARCHRLAALASHRAAAAAASACRGVVGAARLPILAAHLRRRRGARAHPGTPKPSPSRGRCLQCRQRAFKLPRFGCRLACARFATHALVVCAAAGACGCHPGQPSPHSSPALGLGRYRCCRRLPARPAMPDLDLVLLPG